MTVRAFWVGSLLTAIVAGIIWVAIITLLDPAQAGWLGYLLFFLVLFLAVAATAGLAGYGVRRLIKPRQLSAYTVRVALRQGLLLSLFFNLLLFLHLTKLYQWWVVIITILLFMMVELVWLSFDQGAASRYKRTYDEHD